MSFDGYVAAASMFQPLDEAFHGKSKVKPIQDAMDKIYEKIQKEPDWKVQGSKEAKDLEKAFVKVFGFKHCSIYWRYQNMPSIDYQFSINVPDGEPVTVDRDTNIGPYTLSQSCYVSTSVEKSRRTPEGDNYDTNHSMVCFITMDQNLFTDQPGLTSAEMVAVALHEVGHNFDATVFKTISSWMPWLSILIRFSRTCNIMGITPEQAWKELRTDVMSDVTRLLATDIVKKYIPELSGLYYNMEDIIVSSLGPLSRKLKPVFNLGTKAYNTVQAILLPVKIVVNASQVLANIVKMPIEYVTSTLGRKAETYADSFAAQYGYGAELGSALAKTAKTFGSKGFGYDDKLFAPIYDLSMVFQSFMGFASAHENTPERFQRAIRTLEYDLKESGLSAEDKKVIMDEIKRVEKAYDDYIRLDTDEKHFVANTYRKAVDLWIRSDAYDFVQKFRLLPSQTYAK